MPSLGVLRRVDYLDWTYSAVVLIGVAMLLGVSVAGTTFQFWLPLAVLYVAIALSAFLLRHLAHFEPEWDGRLKRVVDTVAVMMVAAVTMLNLIHYHIISEGTRTAVELFFAKNTALTWVLTASLAANAFLVLAAYGMLVLLAVSAEDYLKSARERRNAAAERLKFAKEHYCSLCGDCITLDTPHVVAEEDRRSHLACTLREYNERLTS